MSTMRVRIYDVRFGDAILVSIPDGDVQRHLLIDVGNVQAGAGGADHVFAPIMRDVKSVLGDRPLDVYVMTHEHLDHVQGLMKVKDDQELRFEIDQAWLTASAAEDYYAEHPNAKKGLDAAHEILDGVKGLLAASPESAPAPVLALLANNNYRSTGDCVRHLRQIAKNKTVYVSRGSQPEHPFPDTSIEFWAPEEDTFAYYGRFRPMALGMAPGAGPAGESTVTVPLPPRGVDAGAFYDLVEARRSGWVENLLAIDRAANNTSVVFTIEWQGWRLLFTGDAEIRSWRTMNREGVMKPVHLLKVSHHGSHNGTPEMEILEKVLPEAPPDARKRYSLVSTCQDTYHDVPHGPTLAGLAGRTEVVSVEDLPDGSLYYDILLESDGTSRVKEGPIA